MKNKAVFLDRDGVINRPETYYVWKKEDFFFNEHIFELLKKYQEKGFLLIIISNQGGVSKGLYSKENVEKLHQFMLKEFNERKIKIADIYFCPHHTDIENCLCRKPNSLMIEKAIAKYNITTEVSYLIGDSERDIEAGENVGLNTFLIKKNSKLPRIK